MSTGSGIPGGPDEPVGVTLARMRRERRLTGARLAAMVGMSQPKISRLERGKGAPDPEDVGAVARALGADDDLVRDLMERAERSHDRMADWRPVADVLAARQRDLVDWESTVRAVRDFQPALLPGLLQTSGYARVILQLFQRLAPSGVEGPSEAAVRAALSARIRRQEILADQHRSFRFVVTEAVLRNHVCPPVEMLAQIGHLREISRLQDNVDLRILRDDMPLDIPPLHGFTLFDDKLVIIDVYNTGLLSRGRKDLDSYRRVFDLFESQAVAIEATLDRYEALYIERLRG